MGLNVGQHNMEENIKEVGTQIIGEYGWMFMAGIAILIFRNTIEKIVDGLQIFIGNDYNTDDIVEVDGMPGRIVRIGPRQTVFFLYTIKGGKILSGEKLVVQNEKLKDLKISKPLPELDLVKYKEQEELLYGRRTDDKRKDL